MQTKVDHEFGIPCNLHSWPPPSWRKQGLRSNLLHWSKWLPHDITMWLEIQVCKKWVCNNSDCRKHINILWLLGLVNRLSCSLMATLSSILPSSDWICDSGSWLGASSSWLAAYYAHGSVVLPPRLPPFSRVLPRTCLLQMARSLQLDVVHGAHCSPPSG